MYGLHLGVNVDMSFRICSYYTINTLYYQVAHDYLMPSLSKFNLLTDIRGIKNLGSWNANTSYKSSFVLQMLNKYKEDIVFLDADAEVLQYPDIFNLVPNEYIIAAHYLDKDKWYNGNFGGEKELLSGTCFFRNCDETIRIVKDWVLACENNLNVWEQKLLQQVIKLNNIKVYDLPIEYCYIKTLPNGSEPHVKVAMPVIVHNQVSRVLRNKL